MITNTFIPLDKDSPVRNDAINTIKYTLLLDYQVPQYTDDDLILNVFRNCQKCCLGLFRDIRPEYEKVDESGYHFFGRTSSDNDFHRIGIIPATPTPDTSSGFEPYLHNMIMQHCIFSSYHAVLTALSKGASTAAYGIYNGKHLDYETNQRHSDNQAKSSKAADLKKKIDSHVRVLPCLKELLYKEQFSELCYSICGINASKFKNQIRKKDNREVKLSNFDSVSSMLQPRYNANEKRFDSNTVQSIYQLYLVERIFGFRLFFSIMKGIEYAEAETAYRFEQEDIIQAISSLKNLQNVFSRQCFFFYALDSIRKETWSAHDFWCYNDLASDDTMLKSARKGQVNFDLYRWANQMELFSNYLSQFVIPVFEWCFLGMLLESIENKYSGTSHTEHLMKAKENLEAFIIKHCDQLVRPLDLTPRQLLWKNKNCCVYPYMVDTVTSLKGNWYTEMPTKTFELLDKCFWEDIGEKNLELNLSTRLAPDFFRKNNRNLPNPPAGRIRKFYIDLLRYEYWEPKL